MKNRNLFAAAFFLVFLIALSNAASDSQSLGEGLTTEYQECIETINKTHLISYDVHDPILIVNDTDFANQALDEGWSGNGNEGSPYIIENLDISTVDACIEISDVNVSFAIRSCLLRYDGLDDSGTGVLLSNATHGFVESCVFTMKTDAVHASTSHNLVVFNNTIETGMTAIYLSGSDYCTIVNNTVSDYYYGATCWSSDYVVLYNNTHTSCTLGVFMNGCDDATLRDNIVQGSNGGVTIWNADDATLLNNTIQGGTSHDVMLSGSRYCNLTDNKLNGFGLYIDAFQFVYWSHDLLNNMVQGKPLGYYLSQSGQDIDVSSHGQVFLVDCIGVTLRNGQFSNVMNGMIMVYSEDCAVVNCTAHGSWYHGLRLRSCTNCSSVNCTLYDNDSSGVQINSSPNSQIMNNTIYGNKGNGLYIGSSSDCTVRNCTFVEDGATVDFYDLEDLHHDFSDNVVNGKELGYYWNLTDTVLDGDLYGQIILGNCSRVKIEGGHFHDIARGMVFGYCTLCELEDAVLEDCGRIGLHLIHSENCTVRSSEFIECYERGIYCRTSTNCTLDLNIAHGCMYGISILESTLVTASNNSISESDLYGLRIRLSENVTVWNNTIVESDYALELDDSSNCILSNNSLLFNSDRGLNIEGSDFCLVTNNWIFDSGPYGIDVDSSWNITFYGNSLGSHSMLNARDDGWDNTWDDSVSVGNAWDDHVGPGVYTISGTALSEDRYPSTLTEVPPPLINNPDDIEYESGTTGHSISWNPLSAEPDSFEAYRNATIIDSGAWDGSDIIVGIDGLDLGLYNYTLVVMDTSSNSATDMVFVSVVDTTPPDMEASPDDVEYEVGSTGHSITWSPNDLNPLSYEILRDGVSVQFGDWNVSSEDIVIAVSGLSVGTYNYTLVVMDTIGNSATDTVFVSVEDTTPPNWVVSPSDQSIDYGQALEYQLQATDLSGIGAWYVNDTVNFVISGTGYLENNTILEAGYYGLNISVEDIYGNTRSFTIRIRILPSTTTTTTTTTTTDTTTTTTTTEEVPPPDPMVLVIAIGIGAGVIVIIIIVVIKRKR